MKYKRRCLLLQTVQFLWTESFLISKKKTEWVHVLFSVIIETWINHKGLSNVQKYLQVQLAIIFLLLDLDRITWIDLKFSNENAGQDSVS